MRRKAKLSKIGRGNLRKALYFPAIVAMRFNPVIRNFCARLEKRGKHNKMEGELEENIPVRRVLDDLAEHCSTSPPKA